MSAAKSLVIVESPAKAKTIAGFLGPGFVVESSIGHIRDLPKSADDVPAAFKGTPTGRLGVDVDNDFKPIYVVDSNKKDHIKKLKQLVKEADQLYLATDEDREGESIAWHLLEVLKPKVPVKRLAFHEITKKAIQAALDNPRELDQRLVNAQEARRILDRLYGYEVSPVLWKKVMPKLSAGRVQSVATRIIVEREAERIAFVSASYWDIEANFKAEQGEFSAMLVSVDRQRVATGKDFNDQGKLTNQDAILLGEKLTQDLAAKLPAADFAVQSIESKPNRRSPAAPFMTSTLQQEASRKLRFSSTRTMRAAQTLYEQGYITYMRTDSTTLSEAAVNAARTLIQSQYGDEYLPKSPRLYKNKVKNAQEAHEAIRPAGDSFKPPKQVKDELGGDEGLLYELVWKRTVASQMEDSRGLSVKLTVATEVDDKKLQFAATGNTITFPGFLRAYVEGSDDPQVELDQRETHLPKVEEGESLDGKEFIPKGHETLPPARFTEASLVKRLEELGVGRPSTYASIISTIQARGYVWKKGSALVPSFKAFSVVQLLEQHFGALVDYSFTARMEDELDSIASGSAEHIPWLSRFYFGGEAANDSDAEPESGETISEKAKNGLGMGLHKLVAARLGEIDARAINSLPLGEDEDGNEIVIRVGRYGPYLQRGDDTANIPDDLAPDELDLEKGLEILAMPSGDRLLGDDPETGLPIYARQGRFGAYIQLGEAGGKEKPKTGSLLKTMSVETLTLEEALKMLSLPRQVGVDPEDSKPITAQLGRYGPYISKEKDSRSLETEEQVFSLTLAQAIELFKQPRRRGGRKVAEPLKEIGKDKVSEQMITLREGRFGLYVTDGEVNASLRKGDSPDNITLERAQELLDTRRERGPVKKKKKKSSKKKAAKKTAKKAAAKKASTKKAASKKTSAKKTAKKKTAAKKATTKKTATKKAAAKKATKKSAKKAAKKASKK